ncbi:MAG: hypothetical protein KDA32_01420 [Phycisphaerales bacterium]|nr:hypothetical protein [Phycisphaerales bacterium]
MTRGVITLGIAAVCLALASGAALAETPSAARANELAAQAVRDYDKAVSASLTDSAAAAELYRSSIAAMTTLAESGIRSPALEYNLGNAYYRAGAMGRAVLHYRRAARLAPADADIRANLEYVRHRVEPYLEPDQTAEALNDLAIWKRLPRATQLMLVVALGVIGWGLLAVRLRVRSTPLFVSGAVAVALALIVVASLAADLRSDRQRPEAVIVDGSQVLRRGRGDAYDPVINQALGPGVELRILDERPDWMRVSLPTGETGWIAASSVAKV